MRPFVSPLFPYSTLFRSPPVGIILIDRMVVQLPDYRIEAIAVVCPPSFSRWDAHDLAVFRDFERVPGIQRTPTEPDHLLIRLPVQKSIVGRVKDIEPAAATHIGFELPFGMIGPGQMFSSKVVAVLDD